MRLWPSGRVRCREPGSRCWQNEHAKMQPRAVSQGTSLVLAQPVRHLLEQDLESRCPNELRWWREFKFFQGFLSCDEFGRTALETAGLHGEAGFNEAINGEHVRSKCFVATCL